jgi:hypothetical protein
MDLPNICGLKHPQYATRLADWERWRLAYAGGRDFLNRYLKQFSKREDRTDFRERKAVSYIPAFAKAAINDVKNSIFQRITDVSRDGGPVSYEAAIEGRLGGVDLKGSSMNAFIGREILPELLTMAKVGVFVDMPPLPGPTMADKGNNRPYLYWYKAEDIQCWADCNTHTREFTAVLLRDSILSFDKRFGLATGQGTRYRFAWLGEDGFVRVQYINEHGKCCDPDSLAAVDDYEIRLQLTKIPFVVFELSDSLMTDVADYQIALLNLASSDMSYALKANYPFYTEQSDWRAASPHLRSNPPNQKTVVVDPSSPSTTIVNQEQVKEIRVGVTSGRQYAVGTERPGFIHPSSEPLRVSMDKQEQLKNEIRQLINLALSSLAPHGASAESKAADNRGLEAVLSYIGLELEHGERKIAEFWAMYEGKAPATVNYPENYQLLSDVDRRDRSDHLYKLLPAINSLTYQREIAKQLAELILGSKVSSQKLARIKSEIDKAEVIISDPTVIKTDLEAGLVSLKLASKARGYPEGQVEQAKEDHAERLRRITIAQTPGGGLAALTDDRGQARGVSDLSGNPQDGKEEKAKTRDNTLQDEVKDRTRGEGQ